MKEEIAKKWAAYLRTPDLKQTFSYLGKSNGGRCCLGHLCDLAVLEGVIDAPVELPTSGVLLYVDNESTYPTASRHDLVWEYSLSRPRMGKKE